MELEGFELNILIKSFLSREYSTLDVVNLLKDKIKELSEELYYLAIYTVGRDPQAILKTISIYEEAFPSIEDARIEMCERAREYSEYEYVHMNIERRTMNEKGFMVCYDTLECWDIEKINGEYKPVRSGYDVNPDTGELIKKV